MTDYLAARFRQTTKKTHGKITQCVHVHTYFYRTFLIMHDFIRVTHLHSAKFIDIQRLPELNFRIKFLKQMKSGTEVDMVQHWIKVQQTGSFHEFYYHLFRFVCQIRKSA